MTTKERKETLRERVELAESMGFNINAQSIKVHHGIMSSRCTFDVEIDLKKFYEVTEIKPPVEEVSIELWVTERGVSVDVTAMLPGKQEPLEFTIDRHDFNAEKEYITFTNIDDEYIEALEELAIAVYWDLNFIALGFPCGLED